MVDLHKHSYRLLGQSASLNAASLSDMAHNGNIDAEHVAPQRRRSRSPNQHTTGRMHTMHERMKEAAHQLMLPEPA